ncbi:MAG: hypothetical protein KBH29_10390 [Lutibacter sp.]|nr:hypothetical protein [Lutibacter sp.]
MKKAIRISAIMLVVFSFIFTACDDDILNVDFDTTITQSIPIHINQNQGTVNESAILSLDNSDTNKYLKKIKGVKIKKLTYKITNFSGDANGTINVDFKADNLVLKTEGFIVKSANDNATIFEVTDIDKLNDMANLLKTNKSVSVGITGQCVAEETSMDFKVEVTAKLEVTANPL